MIVLNIDLEGHLTTDLAEKQLMSVCVSLMFYRCCGGIY